MPSSRFDVANPMLEMTMGPDRRVDFDRPIVEATIGGRPVFLVHPDERTASPDEPRDFMVPITTSRMRRAIDIEYDRAAAPYVPSRLLGLGQETDASPFPEYRGRSELTYWAMATIPAAGIGALIAAAAGKSKLLGAGAGVAGAVWTIALVKGLSV
jgi:hypothetical protein